MKKAKKTRKIGLENKKLQIKKRNPFYFKIVTLVAFDLDSSLGSFSISKETF